MSRIVSERELDLQRKLVPFNIAVCLICITAILSLFFGPLLVIDIGKIVRNENTMKLVDKAFDDMVGGELEGSGQEGIDYSSIISKTIKNVFGKVEGKIEISARGALRVAVAPDDKKTQTMLTDIFFGEKGFVTVLINSIVDGIGNIFETDEGKKLMEDTLITTMVTALVADKDSEFGDKLTEENIRGLTEAFKSVEDVTDGDVSEVSAAVCAKVESIMGETLDEETKQEIYKELDALYKQTYEEVLKDDSVIDKKVTVENIICVTASSNVNLGEVDIGGMLNGLFEENGDNGNNPSNADEIEDELPEEEYENGSVENKGTIVTTYGGMLNEMGFGPDQREELKTNIRTTLDKTVNDMLDKEGLGEYLGYYKYVFYFILIFMVLWGILFLAALGHIFTANKRFCMWYVKLFCWIPTLFWLVFKVGAMVIGKAMPDLIEGEGGEIVQVLFTGIGSYTWINGLCYVLLWLLSIFWAFPIKHKIRQERKYS